MSRIEPHDPRDESRLFDNTRGFFRVRKTDTAAQLDALVAPGDRKSVV